MIPFRLTRKARGVFKRRVKCYFCGEIIDRGILRNKAEIYNININYTQRHICKQCAHIINYETEAFISNFCECFNWGIIPTVERCENCPKIKECLNNMAGIASYIQECRAKK